MNKGTLVRKSNYLIEASYKLSLNEQKFVLLLASKIKPSDEDFHPYKISISDFLNFLEIKTHSYDRLDQIIDTLMGKKMKISFLDDEGKQNILNVNWISSTKYRVGDDSIGIRFDPELKPFLLQLKKRFTSYRLRDVIQLRSSFSIRIYELLKQYEGLGERTIEVQKLREMLGVEPEQYSLYANFKMRVILPAKKELAEKTDLSFDFEEIKESHAVKKLRFFIKIKETAPVASETSAVVVSPEVVELQKLYDHLPDPYREMLSVKELVRKAFAEKGFDFVLRNIEYANEGSNAVNPGASLGKGSNYRNYLAASLRKDFGLPRLDDLKIKKAKEDAEKKKADEEARERRKNQEQEQHEKEVSANIQIYLKNLSPEGINTLRQEAIDRMSPEKQELVSKKGLGSEMMVKLAMESIIRTRIKEI